VLDVVRLEAGRLEVDPEPVDLVEVVRIAVGDLGDDGGRVELVVDGDRPPIALTDRRRTWQVVVNLLSNAVKFTPDDQSITVTLGTAGPEVVVEVADHGIGIALERQGTVFERFSREPLEGGRRTGSGLGLYICRRLVEALGGRIWVESEPGVGSTFSFTLPAASP
jgi:signal transduction histidine kinase